MKIKTLLLFLLLTIGTSAQVKLRLNADDIIESTFFSGGTPGLNATTIFEGIVNHATSNLALAPAMGGTGITAPWLEGSMIYAGSANTWTVLEVPVTPNSVLAFPSNIPVWTRTLDLASVESDAITLGGVPVLPQRKAYRTANLARSSTTTTASDTQLHFSVGSGETWAFRFVVYVTAASATPDIKCGLNGPTGPANLKWQEKMWVNNSTINGGATGTSYNTGFNFDLDNTNIFFLELEGTVENGSTAGSVSFDWAQNTSSADATTVLRGSYVIATKLN